MAEPSSPTAHEPFLCPGCGKDVSDFMAHEAHYADAEDLRNDSARRARPCWPWTDAKTEAHARGTICPWDRDYLSAEYLRRNPQPWSYA